MSMFPTTRASPATSFCGVATNARTNTAGTSRTRRRPSASVVARHGTSSEQTASSRRRPALSSPRWRISRFEEEDFQERHGAFVKCGMPKPPAWAASRRRTPRFPDQARRARRSLQIEGGLDILHRAHRKRRDIRTCPGHGGCLSRRVDRLVAEGGMIHGLIHFRRVRSEPVPAILTRGLRGPHTRHHRHDTEAAECIEDVAAGLVRAGRRCVWEPRCRGGSGRWRECRKPS